MDELFKETKNNIYRILIQGTFFTNILISLSFYLVDKSILFAHLSIILLFLGIVFLKNYTKIFEDILSGMDLDGFESFIIITPFIYNFASLYLNVPLFIHGSKELVILLSNIDMILSLVLFNNIILDIQCFLKFYKDKGY